jgi:VWFA-related protein
MRRLVKVLGGGALLAIVSAATMSARQPATAQVSVLKQDVQLQGSAVGPIIPPKQSMPQSSAPSQTTPPQQTPRQNGKTPLPGGTIHTQVNEITTPVTLEDKKGKFLLGLEQKDFHVFDNGVEQQINRWGMDNHQLALALVVETNSHVGMMAKQIHGTGIVFTDMVMALSGEATVISYGDTVDMRQAFTNDHDAVEKAVEGLKFKDDGMRLYDGMWQGTEMLEKQPDSSHRVLLVIGEAQDGGSKHKLDDILAQAQKANITIYTIGLSSTAADLRADPVPHSPDDDLGVSSGGNPVPQASTTTPLGVGGDACFLCVAVFLVQRVTHQKKNHAMAAAVQSTGGAYYHPFKDHNIQYALNAIGNELHSQYILSYQLQGTAQPGIHEIEVRVDRAHVTVRTRLGYYLAPAHP